MPLPPPDVSRKPLHTRTIKVNSFAREDGHWDLEAELIDYKAYDFVLNDRSTRHAGEPVHHMLLRVTIDASFSITDAVVAYEAAPYNQHCAAIAPSYGGLVGLNLLRDFRNAVKQRFGRTAGCTHMSELSYVLPTVAVQTMAGQRSRPAPAPGEAPKRPFQLEGCHALRLDGPVAREHYPMWYVAPEPEPDSS